MRAEVTRSFRPVKNAFFGEMPVVVVIESSRTTQYRIGVLLGLLTTWCGVWMNSEFFLR